MHLDLGMLIGFMYDLESDFVIASYIQFTSLITKWSVFILDRGMGCSHSFKRYPHRVGYIYIDEEEKHQNLNKMSAFH